MDDPNRDERGRFKEGNCANPNGRPKKPRSEKLEAAIREVEQDKGVDILRHFVERALVSDQVLAVLMRKIHPDLRAVEANINAGRLEAAQKADQDFVDEALRRAKEMEEIAKLSKALDNAPDAMAV